MLVFAPILAAQIFFAILRFAPGSAVLVPYENLGYSYVTNAAEGSMLEGFPGRRKPGKSPQPRRQWLSPRFWGALIPLENLGFDCLDRGHVPG